MNRKRTDFNLPKDHKYSITPNWLLGFTEGDGSFNVFTNGSRLIFSLTQEDIDLDLMNKIADFFNNLPGIIISTTDKDKLLKSAPCKEGPAKVYKGRERSLQMKGVCALG